MRDIAAVIIAAVIAATLFSGSLAAQEQERKPVPKDSVRVSLPGCAKGYVFTTGPRTREEPGRFDIPEGMHLRMNAPKKMMAEIKPHEGSMIEITGLMKKGQYNDGINIGGGVRISPGPAPTSGGVPAMPGASQHFIDVEGWRPIDGSCPSR